jgi:hypothetical protein
MNGSSHRRSVLACVLFGVLLPSCCMLHLLPSPGHGDEHGGGCMSGHGTGTSASPGSAPSPSAPDSQTPDSHAYRCPMHPDIHATFASACPKCGMELVKEVE